MNVLILFERSGHVRNAFKEKGHNSISIDLVPSLTPGDHIIMDIRNITHEFISKFDLLIMFPPCTYFSQLNYIHEINDKTRKNKRDEHLKLIKYLWDSPINKIAMEIRQQEL